MVAPLPVSALVHSSTLVTLGVYFVFRFFNYLNLFLIIYLSLIRLIYFSIKILFVFDIKKLIALSTLNNIRFIFILLVYNIYIYIFIYILIHALFKRLIFFCIGIFLFNNFDIQDIRLLGIIYYYIPLSIYLFFISKIIMLGMIYLRLFYCKDLLLDLIYLNKLNNFFFFFFFFFFFIFYIMQIFLNLFLNNSFIKCNLNYENFWLIIILVLIIIGNLFIYKILFLLVYLNLKLLINLILKIYFFMFYLIIILFILELRILIKIIKIFGLIDLTDNLYLQVKFKVL
ncbi:hypothetical protein PGB90_006459 [Kerria lacca]